MFDPNHAIYYPPLKYPCVMQDAEGGGWFVAESTGPVTWRYHRWRWLAILELWHWKWTHYA